MADSDADLVILYEESVTERVATCQAEEAVLAEVMTKDARETAVSVDCLSSPDVDVHDGVHTAIGDCLGESGHSYGWAVEHAMALLASAGALDLKSLGECQSEATEVPFLTAEAASCWKRLGDGLRYCPVVQVHG